MKANLPQISFLLGLSTAAYLLAGCGTCKPGKGPGPVMAYNLQVKLGATLEHASVFVHVIPANPSDLERLRTYSLNKYWRPGDALNRDLPKHVFNFVDSKQLAQTLASTDPEWTTWKNSGAQYLVVYADLPNVFEEGKPGTQDPRRQIIPICECYWPPKTKDLEIEVQASGVRLITAPASQPGQPLPPGW
jgi:hypothetical protein